MKKIRLYAMALTIGASLLSSCDFNAYQEPLPIQTSSSEQGINSTDNKKKKKKEPEEDVSNDN